MKFLFFFALFFFGLSLTGLTQSLTQTVRGVVTDKASGQPLTGVIVFLSTTEPVLGGSTDLDGHFRLSEVSIGRHTLVAKYTGYKDVVLSQLLVNSGKELVLEILMEEDINTMNIVEVMEEKDKRESLNSMATVSSRTFSVEETQKFAAAVNDPGRMAASYAGVISADDGGNQISIRGNSPYGLLWRMEGVDIPNPNHFASSAAAGGGISILSAQTLANSDFMTGAFAAEYGNALGGVFDLRLRKGNNEKREYTLQAGFLGLDAAAEGPLGGGRRGSYLVNYRYSTLSLIAKLGVPMGDAITNFQDLSFNVVMPTERAGTFQVFGFGGLSSQTSVAEPDSTRWEWEWQRYDSRFYSNTGATGLKHVYRLSEHSFLQTTAMASGNNYGYQEYREIEGFRRDLNQEASFVTSKLTLTSVYQVKLNSRSTLRSGVYVNRHGFVLTEQSRADDSQPLVKGIEASGQAVTGQAFSQWKFKLNEKLTMNSGLHFFYLPLNQTVSAEPRAALRYQQNARQSFTAGYGLHSQMQPIGIYRAQVQDEQGNLRYPNENLGLNKSHHFVAGYERAISKYMYIKTEMYYQHLFQIAGSAQPGSTLSTLNNVENYIKEPLANNGRGRNYGMEVTLEQFTWKDFYFLLSASLYQSEFQAPDGVWRNTRFNGNYASSFTGGKEWNVGDPEKNKTLGANLRVIYAGGFRETPIDVPASMAAGETVRDLSRLYEEKNPDYLRADIRISLRRNHDTWTSTLSLDIQNATNRKNVYGSNFDPVTGTVKWNYQVPLIPILNYKVEF